MALKSGTRKILMNAKIHKIGNTPKYRKIMADVVRGWRKNSGHTQARKWAKVSLLSSSERRRILSKKKS